MSVGRYAMRSRVFQGWAFAPRALADATVEAVAPSLSGVRYRPQHAPMASGYAPAHASAPVGYRPGNAPASTGYRPRNPE